MKIDATGDGGGGAIKEQPQPQQQYVPESQRVGDTGPNGTPQGDEGQPARGSFVSRTKLGVAALVFILVVVMGYLVLQGMSSAVSGDLKKTVVQSVGIRSNQSEGVVDVDTVDSTGTDIVLTLEEMSAVVASLKQENSSLRAQLANNMPNEGTFVPEPDGVTSVIKATAGNADILDYRDISTYKELVPYTKSYTQTDNNNYMFFLNIKYGEEAYSLPITYSDNLSLKDSGVILVEVEIVEFRSSESTDSVFVISNVKVSDGWEKYNSIE